MAHVQDGWQAQLPDIVLHTKAGAVSQLKLDLTAVVSTCVSRSACIDFLLRRPQGALSGSSARAKLALSMLRVHRGLLQLADGKGLCVVAKC